MLYCFGGVILMQEIKFFLHMNYFLCVRSVVIEIFVPKEFTYLSEKSSLQTTFVINQ